MRVKAPPGILCPMEHDPTQYISDDRGGTEVPASAYYLRMINDGSLLEIIEPTKKGSKGADGGEQ